MTTDLQGNEAGPTSLGLSTLDHASTLPSSLFGGPIKLDTSSCSAESDKDAFESSAISIESSASTDAQDSGTDDSSISLGESTTDTTELSMITESPAKSIGLPPATEYNPTFTGIAPELRDQIYEYLLVLPGKVIPKKPMELSWRMGHLASCPMNEHPLFQDAVVKGDGAGPIVSCREGLICRDAFTEEDTIIPAPRSVLTLLLVCRLIYNEASPVFYRKNHFMFDTSLNMHRIGEFLTGIGSRAPFVAEMSFTMSSRGARTVIRQLYDCKYLRKLHIKLQDGCILPTLKPGIEGFDNFRTYRGIKELTTLKGLDLVELKGKDRSWERTEGYILDVNDGPAVGPWLRKHMMRPRPEWYMDEAELRKIELEQKAKVEERKKRDEAERKAWEEKKRKEDAAFEAISQPLQLWTSYESEEGNKKSNKGKTREERSTSTGLAIAASGSTSAEISKEPRTESDAKTLEQPAKDPKTVSVPKSLGADSGPRSAGIGSSDVNARKGRPEKSFYKPKQNRGPLQAKPVSTQQAPTASTKAGTEPKNMGLSKLRKNDPSNSDVTTNGVASSAGTGSGLIVATGGWNSAEAQGWKASYNMTRGGW